MVKVIELIERLQRAVEEFGDNVKVPKHWGFDDIERTVLSNKEFDETIERFQELQENGREICGLSTITVGGVTECKVTFFNGSEHLLITNAIPPTP